jgi:hypothetical protein
LSYQIRFRRGTASEWAASDYILADGEPGYDTTNDKFKVGNGTDAWEDLPETVGEPGEPGEPGEDATTPVYTTEADLKGAPNGWAVINVTDPTDWPTIYGYANGISPVRVTGWVDGEYAGKQITIYKDPETAFVWAGETSPEEPWVWGPLERLAPLMDPDPNQEEVVHGFKPHNLVKIPWDGVLKWVEAAPSGTIVYTTEAELQAADPGWYVIEVANETDWPVLGPMFAGGSFPVRITGYDDGAWANRYIEIFSTPEQQVRFWEAYNSEPGGPLIWLDPRWLPLPMQAPDNPDPASGVWTLGLSPGGSSDPYWMRAWGEYDEFPEEGPNTSSSTPRYSYGGQLFANDPVGERDLVNKRTMESVVPIFHTGIGAPADSVGSEGNWYLDTEANILYGPKRGPMTVQPFLLSGTQAAVNATTEYYVGNKFTVATPGNVVGFRLMGFSTISGPSARLYDAANLAGDPLGYGTVPYGAIVPGQFIEVLFDTPPVAVTPGITYALSYDSYGLEPYSAGGMPIASDQVTLTTGVRSSGGGYVADTDVAGNHWIEPIFESATVEYWPVALVGASGEGGLTVYTTTAELDAVTTNEVGFIKLEWQSGMTPFANSAIGSYFGALPTGFSPYISGYVKVTTTITDGEANGDLDTLDRYAQLSQLAEFTYGNKFASWARISGSLGTDLDWSNVTWYPWALLPSPPAAMLNGEVVTDAAVSVSSAVQTTERKRAFLMNSASPQEVRVNPSYGTGFLGAHAKIVRLGTGAVSVVASGGATLMNPFGVNTLRAQGSVAYLTLIGDGAWLLSGDIG